METTQPQEESKPSPHPSGPGISGQALLKKRPDLSPEAFRDYYINHHAPIAIPWCLANGVSYYAQIHRPLRWSTPSLERKYTAAGIHLHDWDAVAEMVFPPVLTLDDYYRTKVGKAYHVQVISPDEKRFLLGDALRHLKTVEPGAVAGERVEFIVGGRAVVDVGGWGEVFERYLEGKRGKGILLDGMSCNS